MRISLKAARINKSLTQEEAAKRLDVSKKTLWSWENGKSYPTADKIDPICELYEVTYNQLKFF